MYPIRFEPIYQDYVWGGDRIVKRFSRGPKGNVAESWEVSDREEAMSVAVNGPFKGKSLHQIVSEMGEDLLGTGQNFNRFPLLVKIIDAKESLSIQVHPDEVLAEELKGEPKTEMWVALEEGEVFAGLAHETTKKELEASLKSQHPEKLLEKISLKRGDAVYVPAGRIHSICAGAFLLEVQQNSNTTYRLHDWHRKGRELHLKEGIQCVHLQDKGHSKLTPRHQGSDFHHQLVLLGTCPYFTVERIDVFDHHHIAAIEKTFQIFFCAKGSAQLTIDSHKEPMKEGDTYLIPACCKLIEVDGRCELIRIRLS